MLFDTGFTTIHVQPRSGILALFLCLLFQIAQGQGFAVSQQSNCAMARAGTGVAYSCGDASGVFYNPATVGEHSETGDFVLTIGLDGGFQNRGFDADYASFDDLREFPNTGANNDQRRLSPTFPHVYASYQATPKLTAGIGAYAPYSLHTRWPEAWHGAFDGDDTMIRAFYIQPTVAYEITDRIRIGGGPIFGTSDVEFSRLLDLSPQPVRSPDLPTGTTYGSVGIPFHTPFADAAFEATGETAWGGHIGATVRVTDFLQVGARYLLPMTFAYDGEARFAQVPTGIVLPAENSVTGVETLVDDLVRDRFADGGTFVKQAMETTIEFPAQFAAGVVYTTAIADNTFRILADYQWTGWSRLNEITLQFDRLSDEVRPLRYTNTSTLRLGVEYAEGLRAGYSFSTMAVPDETATPFFPGGDQHRATLGYSVFLTEFLSIDGAIQYTFLGERRGNLRSPLSSKKGSGPGFMGGTFGGLSTFENERAIGFGAGLTVSLHL